MNIALVTGSSGLIGSQACEFFAKENFHIVGIDNDMRSYFFGEEASTDWKRKQLEEKLTKYTHRAIDIRNFSDLEIIFKEYQSDIKLIIHTAAQPSHDWAAREPLTDFSINANGTLNLLELTRQYSSNAVFIFTSTNKVYGDLPNQLDLKEQDSRWELSNDHEFYDGITEKMSIDQSTHSLFGASKLAADILVQEYGRYFQMKTACFRGGCLTGPAHSGAMLHGFLAYLMKCCLTSQPYSVFGYKAKQVRDNIHSYDLIQAFYEFYKSPKEGEVYNIGGGRDRSISMLEAIAMCEKITEKKFDYKVVDQPRMGDHMWYISGLSKFQNHYPQWQQTFSLEDTLIEICEELKKR